MHDLTSEILAALVVATVERKRDALVVLKGEVAPQVREVTGPLLLRMGAAAKFLGVSRATLWRILRAGTIQKVELFPGSFRVRRADLIKLAEGGFGFSGKVSQRGRPRKGVARNGTEGGATAKD